MIIDYYLDNDTFLGVITLIRSLELRVLIPTISKRIETRNFYDNAKQLLRNADLICGLYYLILLRHCTDLLPLALVHL